MTDELILVVDAGTSATKAAAVDMTGQVVASALRAYPCSHPRPGWVEQDPEVLFTAALDALSTVVHEVGGNRVLALACSAQRATFVPLSEELSPRSHYIGWQDGRGVPVLAELERRLGESYIRRSGMKLDAVSALSKIFWMAREQPDLANSTAFFGAHQTLLLAQLGVTEPVVSPSEASYMGLLDITTRDWASDFAAVAGIDVAKLPRIVESGSVVGTLSPSVARRIGVADGLPVAMGGGDLQLGALGVGAVRSGTVAVGIGTGGGCVAPCTEPKPDDSARLNCLAHIVPGMWEVEGLGAAAGGSFRWFRDVFGAEEIARAERDGTDPYDLLVAQAAAENTATGLVVIPSLAGLGAPHHDPEFPGAVLGLRLHHTRGQVVRAFMEGIILEQRSILETIREVAGDISSTRLWGGVSKSSSWCQMQVNMYGVTGTRCRVTDASVLGAALCGAVAVGAVASFEHGVKRMVHEVDSWQPDPREVERCDEYYQIFQRAVDALRTSGTGRGLSQLA